MTDIPAGDFSNPGLPLHSHEREILQDAYNAITNVHGWDYLKMYTPPSNQGFMFHSPSEKQKEIDAALTYQGHSGASYGWTMRVMEFIAKRGWPAFVLSLH